MRLTLERGTCGNGRTCPNIQSTDRGTYIVQGYVPGYQEEAGATVAAVEVPLTLVPELEGGPVRDGLRFTAGSSVLIHGRRVSDPDLLDKLDLPEGEDAVEVPFALLPELKEFTRVD